MVHQRLKEFLDLQAHKQDYYSDKFGMTNDRLSKILNGHQGLKSDDLEVIIKTLPLTPEQAYYLITGESVEPGVKSCVECDVVIESLKRDKERLYTIIDNFFSLR